MFAIVWSIMSTINISLPQLQVNFIDDLVEKHGFANRSEFVRSLIRAVKQQPLIVSQAASFPFIAPETKSVSKIMGDFKKTKKYSAKFLSDLGEGLRGSTYMESK